MALVDYSSSSSSESVDEQRPAKRRRNGTTDSDSDSKPASRGPKVTSSKAAATEQDGYGKLSAATTKAASASSSDSTAMPPLPSSFYDLYASTVRQSVVDDPSLHQGRKRQTPHVVGNWPSHLYIEWHPTIAQHDLLVGLLDEVVAELNGAVDLKNFLTSELGAPLPLHISLSRPLALPTADKDAFLERVTGAIERGGMAPFAVAPRGLAWYSSPDSDRTFLILRVATMADEGEGDGLRPENPELMSLLTRCNSVAAMFGQPPLYQKNRSEAVGSAFHVSVGWSLSLPGEELALRALRRFKSSRFDDMRSWKIDVSGVKAKIGNVVHHIPLSGRSGKAAVDDSSAF